jgi:uncharacterized surface protein with fasciclin (FAS1) repeats
MNCWTLLLLSLVFISTSHARNLTEVLSSTANLSRLNLLLSFYPGLLDSFASSETTLFAPSDEALDSFVLSQGGPSNVSMETLGNLLAYHTVPTRLTTPSLTGTGGRIIDTTLEAPEFSNLGGRANVVYASAFGSIGQENEQGPLMLYSGVGGVANVTSADVEFDGGVMHVVDQCVATYLIGLNPAF